MRVVGARVLKVAIVSSLSDRGFARVTLLFSEEGTVFFSFRLLSITAILSFVATLASDSCTSPGAVPRTEREPREEVLLKYSSCARHKRKLRLRAQAFHPLLEKERSYRFSQDILLSKELSSLFSVRSRRGTWQ